jgi:hypothetical protein
MKDELAVGSQDLCRSSIAIIILTAELKVRAAKGEHLCAPVTARLGDGQFRVIGL